MTSRAKTAQTERRLSDYELFFHLLIALDAEHTHPGGAMTISEAHFRPLAELTEARLRERLAFHEAEAKAEWCGTLIQQQIQEIKRELQRRQPSATGDRR